MDSHDVGRPGGLGRQTVEAARTDLRERSVDPHECPLGRRVLLDSGEVARILGQDSSNRPSKNGGGDGATTAGSDRSCAEEFCQPIGGEESDGSNSSAASEGTAGGDPDLVRRHDNRHRCKPVGGLVPVDRGCECVVRTAAVGSRRDVDGHPCPIVGRRSDTGSSSRVSLGR
jgi:hypothetical protein